MLSGLHGAPINLDPIRLGDKGWATKWSSGGQKMSKKRAFFLDTCVTLKKYQGELGGAPTSPSAMRANPRAHHLSHSLPSRAVTGRADWSISGRKPLLSTPDNAQVETLPYPDYTNSIHRAEWMTQWMHVGMALTEDSSLVPSLYAG